MIFLFRAIFILLFALISLYGREVYYVDGNPENSFAFPLGAHYHELSIWQKIGYMLAKHGVTISCLAEIDLKYETRESLHQKFGPDRQLLFIDYRGHHPTFSEMRRMPRSALMNILFEPPSVFENSYVSHHYDLFSKVFTFHDGLVDGKQFIKYRYAPLNPMKTDLPSFHERKFACGFYGRKTSTYRGELYTERKRMIRFFEDYHPSELEFYGPGWENCGYSTYRGVVEDKCEIMKHYKFSFAYENTKDVPGYITEKIFDCFRSGVVPIYFGSPTVTDEIPANCFIDFRAFSSYEELYDFLSNMSEEQFNHYLENIREFLVSEKAREFDVDHFVLNIVNGILGSSLTTKDLI